MSDIDIAAIKARASKATPGPWDARVYCSGMSVGVVGSDVIFGVTGIISDTDAEFIAASRADIPALIAEVERLTRLPALSKWTPYETRDIGKAFLADLVLDEIQDRADRIKAGA